MGDKHILSSFHRLFEIPKNKDNEDYANEDVTLAHKNQYSETTHHHLPSGFGETEWVKMRC
jgi:hypothetical protein